MKLRNLTSSPLTSICTVASSNFLKMMTFEWFKQKKIYAWYFIFLVIQFEFAAPIPFQLWFIYCRTTELPSNLLCWDFMWLPDANSKIPKHKEKFAFSSNGSYRTHSSKFEMGIKRLKHMASFPILLWSSGDTFFGDMTFFPIKEYWQSLCMLQFFIVYILKEHCNSHQVFRDIVGHFSMPSTSSSIIHHHYPYSLLTEQSGGGQRMPFRKQGETVKWVMDKT